VFNASINTLCAALLATTGLCTMSLIWLRQAAPQQLHVAAAFLICWLESHCNKPSNSALALHSLCIVNLRCAKQAVAQAIPS
jgi:hypothetical protein